MHPKVKSWDGFPQLPFPSNPSLVGIFVRETVTRAALARQQKRATRLGIGNFFLSLQESPQLHADSKSETPCRTSSNLVFSVIVTVWVSIRAVLEDSSLEVVALFQTSRPSNLPHFGCCLTYPAHPSPLPLRIVIPGACLPLTATV